MNVKKKRKKCINAFREERVESGKSPPEYGHVLYNIGIIISIVMNIIL